MIRYVDSLNLYMKTYGQHGVHIAKVLTLVKFIQEGNKSLLPPIKVMEFSSSPDNFVICDGYSRATAHYLVNEPVLVEIIGKTNEQLTSKNRLEHILIDSPFNERREPTQLIDLIKEYFFRII